MRVNVEKVLERDQKLSEMDRRADELQVKNSLFLSRNFKISNKLLNLQLFQEGASQFQQHAVKLKKKAWWENVKIWIILSIVILTLVIIIIIVKTRGETPSLTNEVVGNSNVVPEIPIPTEEKKFVPDEHHNYWKTTN